MENTKRYYGADASDEVLPWIFYRMIESEQSYNVNDIEIVFELPEQSFKREIVYLGEISGDE